MKSARNLFLLRLISTFMAAALLASCGGGGSSNSATPSPEPPSSQFHPSSTLANVCTAEGQKSFIRSYMDEMYLWYKEIPQVESAGYSDVVSYFGALLVRAPDASGLPKDRFSAVLPSAQALALLSQDFGRPQFLLEQQGPLLKTEPDSVPMTKVMTTQAGRKIGYVVFLDHDAGSQDALIGSFQQLQQQKVADLVLDLRYNSGGFLYVALAAASMVAGPGSEGQVFEQLRYSDKRAADNVALHFSNHLQFAETQYPRGTALPQLNLPRLYVLSSNLTCSSSESIVNSLRGIGVEVILVGQTTCGKPYGFRRKDNCEYSFFPIEFQGFNAKGFGDYTTGFKPTCAVVSSDTATPLGSTTEPLLAAAMTHIDTGACPAPTSTASDVLRSKEPSFAQPVRARPPWAGRMLVSNRHAGN